jgi:hypothetical protein
MIASCTHYGVCGRGVINPTFAEYERDYMAEKGIKLARHIGRAVRLRRPMGHTLDDILLVYRYSENMKAHVLREIQSALWYCDINASLGQIGCAIKHRSYAMFGPY